MNKTYEKIKKKLTSKEKFHIKLGLERVSEILDIFDNPQNKIRTIHIAGTNGKGSTSAMLAKILEKSGYKTGLFTSPHLVKYNERIKISSNDISDKALFKLLEEINQIASKNRIILTEFEILTIAAFLYFQRENVDIAVIETGLGGRLDATNVINPLFEIITSISLDHTERLGDTIEKIALEKAGIIKTNSIVVINPDNSGIKTIKKTALKLKANVLITSKSECEGIKDGINHIKIGGKTYKTNLLGDFQAENLALAIKAIEVLKEKGFRIKNQNKALLEVSWAGRMQFLDRNTILDGAHNPSAARVLRQSIDNYYAKTPKIWFYGALKNKDFEECIKILFSPEDTVYFVEFNAPNSCTIRDYENKCNINKINFINIKNFKSIYDTIKNTEIPKIICGSLYLAGEIIALLGNK